MVAVDPHERPAAETVLVRPFFWDPQKRLQFICEASDRFEALERQPPPTPTLICLEEPRVVGADWQKVVDRGLLYHLGKYRKYDGNSVRDLPRVVRNTKQHWHDLSESIHKHFGGDVLVYFATRFPSLVLHVYDTVAEHLRDEPMFHSTFYLAEHGL